MEKEHNLFITHPEIAAEWHPTKNGDLSPEQVTSGTRKKVWWLGKCGHEWQSAIYSRTSGAGCPYCAGQKILPGFNDLTTTHPELTAEWHPTKNNPLLPSEVSKGTDRKVWWQCEKGHEWQSPISGRANGTGCPYCSGRLPIVGENDLSTTHPELASEWHPTKNGSLYPFDVKAGSPRKVWWQCEKGHKWQATIARRVAGSGCSYCSGRFPILGETDLATTNPELVTEWHPLKNEKLLPTQVSSGSGKKVWWKCSVCGHEWSSVVSTRVKGAGCPICGRRKASYALMKCDHRKNRQANTASDGWSLKNIFPEIAAEWHPTKNEELLPSDVAPGSEKKVWWICEKGHEWQAQIASRSAGTGCPYCSGRYAIPGETDLATANPFLASEWHPTKNGKLHPSNVKPSTHAKVWWQCSKGHEWKTTISGRNAGSGCPYCSGRLPILGETDLATTNPELLIEWHPTKNGDLTPEQFTPRSEKKVWWICRKGHEWKSIIASRSKGIGCPDCAKEMKTSFAEQAIFFYFNQLSPTLNRYQYNGKTEIDVYLPDFRFGIEYDGYFHDTKKAQERDARKDATLAAAGIFLIRVIEKKDLTDYVDTDTIIYCKPSIHHLHLKEVLEKLLSRLNAITGYSFTMDIDIDRDRQKIFSQYIENEKANSFAANYPEIAAEWHPTKNGALTPEKITSGSHKKVWWLGKCGHEWDMPVKSRAKGAKCPYCSSQRILVGVTDLSTTRPDLAKEWHPSKNESLTPSDVMKGTGRKVWWQCSKGHEWQATVASRALYGNGCPICYNEKRKQKRKPKNETKRESH